jgi:hypothetical protein
MGLRDIIRNIRKRVDTSPFPDIKEKVKMHHQQHKENHNGIRPIDINAPV